MATDHDDALGSVRALVIGLRWGAVAVGIALSASRRAGPGTVVAGLVLAGIAALRTAWPAHLRRDRRGDLALLAAEAVVAVGAAAATGGWLSPYLFSVLALGVAVGYGLGLGPASGVAVAMVVGLSVGAAAVDGEGVGQDALLGAAQVLLVTLVAGYARRLFVEQVARVSQANVRADRLAEANDLLFELYRVAQQLPVSLDLGDTLGATVARVRDLLRPDALVAYLPDDGADTWSAAVAEGVRTASGVPLAALPSALVAAAVVPEARLEPELVPGSGVAPTSGSGIYVALRARGQLVGLIAVERREAGSLTLRDAQLLEGLAEQAALAIDNARLFRRLRTVGADEERTRIARELHDRVGQSLAYLAFELERAAGRAGEGPLGDDLRRLRDDARGAVSEVRETLYDLRTEVTEDVGLAAALQAFLDRVRARSGLEVAVRVQGADRPPLTQERELLRIAQEAVTNVERHAHAQQLTVTLVLEPARSALEVADDGCGFDPAAPGRADAYGVRGMRERADAIGASLEVTAAPGRGTVVRCALRHEPSPVRAPGKPERMPAR